MPEVGDHYIGADTLRSRGEQMARGHVVEQSCDSSGNVMGSAHANLFLDTRMYRIEFAEGEIIELTPNFIAESIYA